MLSVIRVGGFSNFHKLNNKNKKNNEYIFNYKELNWNGNSSYINVDKGIQR